MSRHEKRVFKDIHHVKMDGDRRVSETRHTETKIPSEPDFVKLYTEDVANLNGIKGHQKDVLAFMAAIMNYDNVAIVSPGQRVRWAKELGITISTINCSISRLMRAGHIRSESQGEYIINPNMFAKGEWLNTVKKREDFDAYFIVNYKNTETGYKRTFRKAKLEEAAPDNMKIDPETGEIKYTRRGRPCKKPTTEDVVSTYEHNVVTDL